MKRATGFLFAVALSLIVGAALIITREHNIANAGTGCGPSTIAGTYAFAIDGLVSTSFRGEPQRIGNFIPGALAGTFSFDGQQTVSRAYTLSVGGLLIPINDSGAHTVNSDCTGSAFFADVGETWNLVIVGSGKEVKAMDATPGFVVAGVLTRQ